ncbi:MAG: tRNA (guanosine(46)-N7)-methyltransferase TrmB [Ferruginibacter sp.]
MAQKKLIRFAQLKTFSNVWEYPEAMQGKWATALGNNKPIILELACGRGEYTVGLARAHEDKNFIGIDVKGHRMFLGAKSARDENIPNAFFLRTQIERIAEFFAPGEVSEIWITFPDPQPRTSKAKKRLTHPRFLKAYHSILKPGGPIHLKTDSPDLYEFTKLVIQLTGCKLVEAYDNVYTQRPGNADLAIKTHYEALDIAGSKKIHYLKFILPKILPDVEAELKTLLAAEHAD